MAQENRRRTSRPEYQTNGAAAYDVHRLERTEFEDGGAARRLHEPEHKRRPQPKPKPKAKLDVAPLGVIGLLAVACMLVFVICSYVQVFEESAQVADLHSQLAEAQDANERLQAEYDSMVDLNVIQQKAEKLGMTLPNSKQTVYLNLQGVDRAVISTEGAETLLETAWTAIVRSFHTVLEYFS